MDTLPFTKVVGTGNDFIIVDALRHRYPGAAKRWPMVSRALCDRHRGIGADGVLVLEPSKTGDVRMRIFNADGSEAEMCGNGARCVARFVAGNRANGSVTIETGAGVLSATVTGDRVRMRMTDPKDLRIGESAEVDGRMFNGTCINTGVPHFVVPVQDIAAVDVDGIGRALRRNPAFGPKGTNVNFIQAEAGRADRVLVRTYERGVEAETLACGTGVTASAIAFALTQRSGRRGVTSHRIAVQARSGDVLHVSCRIQPEPRGWRIDNVFLEGAARIVYRGEYPLKTKGSSSR